MHDSQSGACFKNHSEETSPTYVCGIKVVNYVESSALNTRLFSKLSKDMDADHTALLYHTQVRWLSKENMLSRIFELREEVKLFLVAKQKHDLLLPFGETNFLHT